MHLDIDGAEQCLQYVAIDTKASISLSWIRAEVVVLRSEVTDHVSWVGRFPQVMQSNYRFRGIVRVGHKSRGYGRWISSLQDPSF